MSHHRCEELTFILKEGFFEANLLEPYQVMTRQRGKRRADSLMLALKFCPCCGESMEPKPAPPARKAKP